MKETGVMKKKSAQTWGSIVFLAGGRNCKTEELPESYSTLKGYYRDGKHSDWLFKVGSKLAADLDARRRAIEKERQECIRTAPKRQRIAELRKVEKEG